MTYIFSWGGGVNSTAILAMIKLGMLPELNKDNTHIVFADTGAEMPYTYEHTTRCLDEYAHFLGWTVKWLNPRRQPEFYYDKFAGKTLEMVCLEKGWIPSSQSRWCSVHFKRNPISNYRKNLCGKDWKENSCILIGYAFDEIHRARDIGFPHTMYPLIDHKLDRQGCIDLIKKAGLPVARKSGCYFCPMQSKAQWIELYKDFPDYFKKAEEIENKNDKGFTFIKGKKLGEKIKYWKSKTKCDDDLFQERHCLCEL
jgi:3'-phosphoadenosine 5'-phosphosulfate sulfotransferase (PAPS reductase)/FAD synthetase